MKFFSFFSPVGFSNSYLIGPDGGGDALLVDPGSFDAPLLEAVETNGLYVRAILLTHAHGSHTHAVGGLLKVYRATVYNNHPSILDFPARHVGDGDELPVGGVTVRVLETPGHSIDSVCYLAGHLLFTGDTLLAGGVGSTRSGYARGVLLSSIRRKVLGLPDPTLVFPGHGPPSRVGVERAHNPYLGDRL